MSSETRIIKRYANRKLYDTQHSRYVTLDQIAEMIRAGDDVKIIDNKTKEDLTSVTLAQIIFEEEKKQRSFLPLQAMRNIIQHGGEQFTQLVTQAQKRVGTMIPRKREGEDGDHPDDVADGEILEDEGAAPSKGGALPEFRDWVEQSQRTVDEWQKKVDARIRAAMEGMGLQTDVRGLTTRIKDLEAKLRRLAASAERKGRGEHDSSEDEGGR